jgi:hypothetical protein
MANLFWTIVPFVLTFIVAAWAPQTDEPQSTQPAAHRPTNPCLN